VSSLKQFPNVQPAEHAAAMKAAPGSAWYSCWESPGFNWRSPKKFPAASILAIKIAQGQVPVFVGLNRIRSGICTAFVGLPGHGRRKLVRSGSLAIPIEGLTKSSGPQGLIAVCTVLDGLLLSLSEAI
jgi:hypothetical protein